MKTERLDSMNAALGLKNIASLLEAKRLTPAEVARYLDVSVATLANWRSVGRGPTPMRLGRRVWYFAEDVEQFLQEERRRSHALKNTADLVLPLPVQIVRPARFDRITGHGGPSKGRQMAAGLRDLSKTRG
jgi:hypothetical protein